ncbi:hypothetical protein [Deinococcus sp.]|uniref:hypothetical protein n=1 Tax=Deinococcus sp. TaxID=47478 RepID=UPI003B5930B4
MTRLFLEARNALWRTLRQHMPGEPEADAAAFDTALQALAALTGWNRARILAGLGLNEAELNAAGEPPP